MVDAGVDMSMEQVLFTRDLFLPSMIEGCFSVGDILVLDRFLYNRGTVVGDFGDNANVFKASKSIVNQKVLGEMQVEEGEVVILFRDARGSSGTGVENFSIDSL